MSIVNFCNVTRVYTSGEHQLKALNNVSFTLDEGKFVVILGPSGAGKSTLLNMLGGLDGPTSGTITINGKDISKLNNNELADYRASEVGFVFQSELSGGEQQRVSIAHAIAKNPKILLCDEPTGALDSETGVLVLKLLLSMAKNYGKTIIVVTHNQNIAKMADVIIKVKNGEIKSYEEQSAPIESFALCKRQKQHEPH